MMIHTLMPGNREQGSGSLVTKDSYTMGEYPRRRITVSRPRSNVHAFLKLRDVRIRAPRPHSGCPGVGVTVQVLREGLAHDVGLTAAGGFSQVLKLALGDLGHAEVEHRGVSARRGQ